jgi:hypothetical protein
MQDASCLQFLDMVIMTIIYSFFHNQGICLTLPLLCQPDSTWVHLTHFFSSRKSRNCTQH